MSDLNHYHIFPLGDSAITIEFAQSISDDINRQVLACFYHLRKEPVTGMIEAVPAYSSLTIYYDVVRARKAIAKDQTVFEGIKHELIERLRSPIPTIADSERLMQIPVCYESGFAPDLERLANERSISTDEVVRLHLFASYRVHMLGFLPGFAYLGEVHERIAMPRKSHPVQVLAGSIGIAGHQTGIYPLDSPGGWHIIGRTPLRLFDPKNEVPLLMPGDTVQFVSISSHEFTNY